MADDEDENIEDDVANNPRGPVTIEQRVMLLERDTRRLARSFTEFTKLVATPEQVAAVVRKEFSDAGLRLDDAEHQDEAREDMRFLRKLRRGVDGTASKIGWTVIAAIVGAAIWLFTLGIHAWKGSP